MKKTTICLGVLLWTLASFTAGVEYQRGDVSQDGMVNIRDVSCLINYLLTGTWTDESVTPPDEHEWVDLGLPSGTLWATCNVGASAPEEYGDYFAWGETEPKEVYNWGNYKWCSGDGDSISNYNYYNTSLTKYCYDSGCGYNGFVDNKTELDPEDDAAYVNWGPAWRMPTKMQQTELREECSWQWTQINGVDGQLVTGPNGNSMFLPAGNFYYDGYGNPYIDGRYWARTLDTIFSFYADYLYFNEWYQYWDNVSRYIGREVRAVRVSQD